MNRMIAILAAALTLAAVIPARADDKPANQGLKPRVKVSTSLGDFVIELDGEKAPISTLNFIAYAEEKFYDGTVFHRVIPDFMIQGGGYTPEMDKKPATHPQIKNEWKNGLKNTKGTVAMARLGGQADSASSEFFINVVDNAFLDQSRDGAAYAVFGNVVEGLDVIDKIKTTKCIAHPKYPGGAVTPETAVVIKSATLTGEFDREGIKKKVEESAVAEKNEKEKVMIEAIAKAEEETKQKVTRTASGLGYIVLKEGTGAQPTSTDKVEVHYTGWLVNGTKFDSSVDRGQPAQFFLNQVIPGWTEGVALMKVGEKRKLVIPPNLGYGARGAGGTIPPNAALIFDVELLNIIK